MTGTPKFTYGSLAECQSLYPSGEHSATGEWCCEEHYKGWVWSVGGSPLDEVDIGEVLAGDDSPEYWLRVHADIAETYVGRALERAELAESAAQIESEPGADESCQIQDSAESLIIGFGGASMVDYLFEAASVHARLAQAFAEATR